MSEDRLTNLVILSIKPEYSKNINFSEVTNKLVKLRLENRNRNIITHYCDREIYRYKSFLFCFVFPFLKTHVNVITKY